MRKLLFIIAIFSIATAFQPQNKEELQSALTQWGVDASAAEAIYGHVSSWDVSLITDMSNLFPGTGYNYGFYTDYCCENNDANMCHSLCDMINYSPGPHPFESYEDCFEVFYEE